jgi:hypothetical protein
MPGSAADASNADRADQHRHTGLTSGRIAVQGRGIVAPTRPVAVVLDIWGFAGVTASARSGGDMSTKATPCDAKGAGFTVTSRTALIAALPAARSRAEAVRL